VALVFFGDGAVQEGAFHESINLAAIWTLPVIFYCENNQYAMTTSFGDSSPVPNVADRAAAYGIPGVVVDGQDVVECWRATDQAVQRARAGIGPSLIEAKTHRYLSHSYRVREHRPASELEHDRQRDPLDLFRLVLIESGTSQKDLEALEAAVEQEVNDGAAFARASELPDPSQAFTDLYSVDGPPPSGDPQW
jgi:pyruvate dehydrogenase E1 component alpha subunit